jgi:hypothetical protein
MNCLQLSSYWEIIKLLSTSFWCDSALVLVILKHDIEQPGVLAFSSCDATNRTKVFLRTSVHAAVPAINRAFILFSAVVVVIQAVPTRQGDWTVVDGTNQIKGLVQQNFRLDRSSETVSSSAFQQPYWSGLRLS